MRSEQSFKGYDICRGDGGPDSGVTVFFVRILAIYIRGSNTDILWVPPSSGIGQLGVSASQLGLDALRELSAEVLGGDGWQGLLRHDFVTDDCPSYIFALEDCTSYSGNASY